MKPFFIVQKIISNPLAIGVFTLILFRLFLINAPLERDEGEYAYMAARFLDGDAPFASAYNMKLPGVALIYAGFLAVFGHSIATVHIALLCFDLLTLVLMFLLLHQAKLPKTLVQFTLFFLALLLTGWHTLGFASHATHFVLPFTLASLWFVLKTGGPRSLLMAALSGLAIGLAIICKQQALLPGAVLGLALLHVRWKATHTLRDPFIHGCIFALLTLAPLSLIILWTIAGNTFSTFKFWTYDYAQAYTSLVSLPDALEVFIKRTGRSAGDHMPLWIAAIPGIYLLVSEKIKAQKTILYTILSVLGIGSFLSIVPGLYFRPHYYVMLLPCIALAGSAAIYHVLSQRAFRSWSKTLSIVVMTTFFVIPTGYHVYWNILVNHATLHAKTYGTQLFIQSPEIARDLSSITPQNQTVANLSCEPQILFYANRTSASGYIYMYSLMEEHIFVTNMQQQVIREIEHKKPASFLYIPEPWDRTARSHPLIFDWIKAYLTNYTLVHAYESSKWLKNRIHPLLLAGPVFTNTRHTYTFLYSRKPRDIIP